MNEIPAIPPKPDTPPPVLFTPEEEAALLTEYGVKGPYDDLLSVPAASRFCSHYGNPNVFLTGEVDCDAADENADIVEELDQPSEDLLLHCPIDALVCRYTFSFTNKAPTCLVQSISDTLANFQARPHSSASATFSPNEAPEISSVEAFGEGSLRHSTLDEADSLLAQADACLQKSTYINRHTDPYLIELRAQLSREEELIGTTDFGTMDEELGFPSEREALELLQRSKELRERVCARKKLSAADLPVVDAGPQGPFKSPGGGEVEPKEGEDHDVTHTLSRPSSVREPSLPRLFAFEVGCTLEQAEEQNQWSALLRECEARHSEEVGVLAPAAGDPLLLVEGEVYPVDPEAAVLLQEPPAGEAVTSRPFFADSDTKLPLSGKGAVKLASPHFPRVGTGMPEERAMPSLGNSSVIAPQWPSERSHHQHQEGGVVMESFPELLDRLLPPTTRELALRETVMDKPATTMERNDTTMNGDLSLNALTTPSKEGQEQPDVVGEVCGGTASSLLRIQRQVKLESMLIEREALESRLMREEDARIERFLLEKHLSLELAKERAESVLEMCERARCVIVREEQSCFEELLRSKQNHLKDARRMTEERQNREFAQLSGEMLVEFKAHRERIKALCEVELAELAREKARDLCAIQELRRSRLTEGQSRLPSPDRPFPDTSGDANVAPSVFFSPETLRKVENLRMKVLLREYESRRRWLRFHHAPLIRLITQLQQEEELRRRPPTPRSSALGRPETRARTSAGFASPNSLSPSLALDADMLCRTQASLLLTFEEGIADASRCFHALCFSLENIQTVDWESVRSVRVGTRTAPSLARSGGSPPSKVAVVHGGDNVVVCDWVRDLDIGSNALEAVSLLDVITTFPSLRRLNLSDNRIATLDHAKQSASLSSASLSIRSVASAQQNALSERAKLSELNVASNNLRDMNAVREYLSHSITRLFAYANRLVSIEPLCSCLRLTKLELNRNSLSNIEPLESLSLLQELNLCDNSITEFSGLSKGSWPLLEKLYLSNNALSTLLLYQAGDTEATEDVHCLFLSQLFVNHNRFMAFSENELPWMPMLSVLQAEGNQLRDISGLVRCPRLTSAKLSFNQLQSLHVLKPLGVCRLLTNLDLRGNPLMALLTPACDGRVDSGCPDTDGKQVFNDASPIALFRRMFPSLTELNNESQPHPLSDTSKDSQAQLLGSENGCPDPASAATQALAADAFAIYLRARREALFVSHRRGHHRATILEAQTHAKGRQSRHRGLPSPELLTLAVADEQQVEVGAFFQAALRAWGAGADPTFDGDFSRLRGAIPAAGAEGRARRAAQARQRVAAWLLGVVRRRRRAQREAEAAAQREAAARRIQPVWRGAALRARLKRILHAHHGALEEGEGEEAFVKVDLDTLPCEGGGEAWVDDFGAIVRRAVRGEDGPLPCFALSPARLSTAMDDGEPGLLPPSRPSGDPHLRDGADSGGVSRTRPASSSTDHELNTQWDPSVALQIGKKLKKMKRAHQQHISEEFMRDPLKFKHKKHQGSTKR